MTVSEALDEQRTMVADEDILLIRIGYQFDDGSFDEWYRGTGFIVGQRYIMTRQTLVDTGTESTLFKKIVRERGEAYKRVGVSLSATSDAAKHIRILVTDITGDSVEISDTAMKNGLGLLITKRTLESPACVFADVSKLSMDEGMTVGVKAAGNADDRCLVNTFSGTVVIDEELKAGFAFNMETKGAYPAGAPVYDGEGHIVGMVSGNSSAEGKTSYSAKALEAFLAMNGVEYRTIEKILAEGTMQEQAEDEEGLLGAELAAVDKSALEESIEKAAAIDTSDYTKDTAAALETALEKAKEVASSDMASQEEVDQAKANIDVAIDNLKEKGMLSGLSEFATSSGSTIVTVIALVIGILAASIVLAKKGYLKLGKTAGKKKKEKPTADKEPVPEPEEFYTEEELSLAEEEYAEDSDIDMTHRKRSRNSRIPKEKKVPGLTYADETMEKEGKVENLEEDGSSDTTVLKKTAFLTRLDNGKTIQIKKDNFVIGKEKSKVDYCISGNPTVSRTHCRIKVIGGNYYIEDLGSTNYTYYNGEQIPEYKSVQLDNGAKIRISDVEFEFSTGKKN